MTRSVASTHRQPPPCQALAAAGIDMDDVVQVLEDEGVEKFETSWNELLESTKAELERLGDGGRRMSVTVQVAPTRAAASLAGLAARLVAKDPTLWGPEAQPEAEHRLGWLDLPQSSQALLPQLARAARAARVRGPRPRGARRHGRLVAGPGGHHAHRRRRPHRPRQHRPAPGRRGARRPDRDEPSWSSPPRAAAPSRPTATAGRTSRPSVTRASPTPRSPTASWSSPTPARRWTGRPSRRATASCSPTPTSAAGTAHCPPSA